MPTEGQRTPETVIERLEIVVETRKAGVRTVPRPSVLTPPERGVRTFEHHLREVLERYV